MLNKLFFTILMILSTFITSARSEIKIGVILGFTGPIESLTPAIADSAEIAFKEASDSGSLLNGETITIIRADSTCNDPSAAIAAAEGVIAQGVTAILGAVCPEATETIFSESALPSGMVMISPGSTSSLLDNLDNKGFFRISPSDSRGGQILADITKDRKIKKIAITYTNSNYEKDLAYAYKEAAEKHGIKVTTIISHEKNKDDYSSEVASLVAAEGDAIALISDFDQGGKEIIQASIDTGAFNKFILSDRMMSQSLIDIFGKKLKKSFGYIPGSKSKGAVFFDKIASSKGINSSDPYTGESYDAAALIILAIQASGNTDGASIAKNILAVGNEPGTKIYPGELKKALDLLAKGKKIDYEGVTGVNFNENGEAKGSFLEQEVKGGKFKTKRQR